MIYPDFKFTVDSTIDESDGVELVVMESLAAVDPSMSLEPLDLHDPVYSLRAVHILEQVDCDAHEVFFDKNRGQTITITFMDGLDYSVIMEKRQPVKLWDRWMVTTEMKGKRNAIS